VVDHEGCSVGVGDRPVPRQEDLIGRGPGSRWWKRTRAGTLRIAMGVKGPETSTPATVADLLLSCPHG
jgi:hypothetical protein